MSDDTTGNDDSIVGELAEDIDCARLAAEAALNLRFTENAIVGYGGRSAVYLSEHAGLKVYIHRWQERCAREASALHVAAYAPDLRIPDLLAHEEIPGHLSWLACTRLAGTQPGPDAENTTPILGQVAARLHTLPTHEVDELAEHRRRLRELPDGTTTAHQAARQLDAALPETVLPAKMTLALHASRELAQRLLRVREPLHLPAPPEVTTTGQRHLVASRPWTLYRETA